MLRFGRGAAHWVGRHAFPTIVAAVIALGAAGGGIGYAVASQHSTAAPIAAPNPTPTPSGQKGRRAGPSRGAALVERALAMLASQTGQSVASVRSQLEAGRSIDDIAGAKAAAIESEILNAITKFVDTAVSSGRITAAQEATDLGIAKTRTEALMAEPGTHLVRDARSALRFLQTNGNKGAGAPTATPTPAA